MLPYIPIICGCRFSGGGGMLHYTPSMFNVITSIPLRILTSCFFSFSGTTHGMDFYYIFGEPFRNSTPAIQEQFIFNNVSYNDNDREYSYYMLELQANFVKYG